MTAERHDQGSPRSAVQTDHTARFSRRTLTSGALAAAGATALGKASKRSAFAAPAVIQGGPVEIQYWHINTESFGGPAVQEIATRFMEANPDIRVTDQFQQNAYTGLLENLQASLAAGNPPDVAQIGYLYLDYVRNNFPYADPNELDAAYGTEGFLAGFPENVTPLSLSAGELMGLPYAISNPITYYNADIFVEAGLDPETPPQTVEEWRAASEQIVAETGKLGLYIQLLDDNWSLDGLIGSNGGQMLGCGDNSALATFDSPEAAGALQWWADLCLDNLSLNVLWEQGFQAFLAGEVAGQLTTPARRAALEAQSPFDLRATFFPRFGENALSLPTGGNTLMVFSQDDAKREAAWRFMEYLYSPEALNIWIQGTGYIPPRPEATAEGTELAAFVESNAIQRVAVDQLPAARKWITFPGSNGLQAQQEVFNATQQALGGQRTAEEALGDAANAVNGLIAGEPCE